MALKDTIQAQVRNAMSILGGMELTSVITYFQVTAPSYDPATGVITPGATSTPGVKAVLASFSLNEKDGAIVVVTDRKAIIAYLDLPIAPAENDYFTTADSVRWEVKRVLGVPGDSVHILHVRRA